jgi:TP901 family phage tail tape measure protein
MAGPTYGRGYVDLVARMDEGSVGGFKSSFVGAMGPIAVAAGAALVAGIGAAVGVGVKSVLDFAGFEQSMNEVFTLLPGISGDAMSEMQGQVKDFATEFGVLPDQVVPALYQSLSAGVPSGNVFEFLETAQMAAKGGVTDLTTAVDGISSVVNAYGTDVIDAAEASDLMFTAVRLGKTNFEELSSSLFNVTPTAAALGVGFGDVTAGLAAMTAQGVPTSVATTQMRQLFVELSKEGSNAAKILEGRTGHSFAELMDQGFDLNNVLQIMVDESGETGTALQDMFGSVEAGSAALALTGSDAFFSATQEMQNSAGATEAAFEQMDQGLSASWDKIKASISVALLGVGEQLAPFVQQFSDFLVDKLPGWIDAGIALFDRVKETVGPILSGLSGDTSGLMSTFQSAWKTISAVVGVAVEIIGDLLANMRQWFEENRETIAKVMGQIHEVIQRVTEIIARLWNTWGETIMALMRNAWSTISGIISGALDVILGVLDFFIGLFTGDWDRMK